MILFQISMSCEVIVTLLYWSIIHKTGHPINKKICLHVIPLLALIIEFGLVYAPFLMRHFLPIAITGILYLTMNFILSIYGETAYKILSWKNYSTVILILAAIVISTLTHTILVLISK